MNQEKKDFLTLAVLPAHLGIAETSWYLGFTEHDISNLASSGMLKLLGHPPSTGSKYFVTAELQALRADAGTETADNDSEENTVKQNQANRLIRRVAVVV